MTDVPVTVRMYNVGFGDCFAVTLPARDRPRKVLIDCGKHPSGPKRDMRKVVADVIGWAAAGEADGRPRIDVVVATHRHHDHVSGFRDAAWQQVEVGEVWLPWTEDPDDPDATRIRERQSRTARLMLSAFGATAGGTFSALLSNLANDDAMRTLHTGFAGSAVRRYLSIGSDREPPVSGVLPGVRTHVLGPSRDEATIRDLDPPEGQHYLAQMEASPPTADNAKSWRPSHRAPFGERWQLRAEEVAGAYRSGRDGDQPPLTPDMERSLATIQDFDPLAVAVGLDKAVNGTSLMLLFQVGSVTLLFAGDAEWGTWNAALEDARHRDLLGQTDFYKVSHHGSYNGTPRRFTEEVLGPGTPGGGRSLISMVSTGHVSQWPLIPKPDLVAALGDHGRILVRSDEAPASDVTGVVWTTDYAEVSIWPGPSPGPTQATRRAGQA